MAILRWWRHEKAPYEEWHLLTLKEDGKTWLQLAIVRQVPDRIGWNVGKILHYPSGWQSIPHGYRVMFRRRVDAFRAAELLVPEATNGVISIRHWIQPAIEHGGWTYPPNKIYS